MMEGVRIAVIGLGTNNSRLPCTRPSRANPRLGPAGLTALKTLREEGFNVVAFERRDEIGGLWAFSDDAGYTSVLKETVCNVSKFVVST